MPSTKKSEIIFDMRCLQDEAYRTRGVGKVASAILSHARNSLPPAGNWQMVGLLDRESSDLAPVHRELLDQVRYTTCGGDNSQTRLFVGLSPMTHDPLFVARLLDNPNVFSAAISYDFIPLAEPARYLPGPAERIAYSLCLYWLSRYRLFAPISNSTAQELGQRLSIAPSDMITIGAPLTSSFPTDKTSGNRMHVLVVGGADKRKNAACAIRAHAQSELFKREKIGLTITGNYDKNWRKDLSGLHKASGGEPKLLRFAGHVDQTGLVELYRSAFCVVCMSTAEGFSLPVIEAMACGTPVIASDIAAHRELIKLPQYLLPCDADADVRRRMENLFQNTREAAHFVETHNAVWPQFTQQNVANRFWSAVLSRLGPNTSAVRAPTVSRRRRPRVAFMTPLPPARSGVADYTAACLKEFARYVDVTVYTNTSSPSPIDGVAAIRPMSAFPHLSPDYDRVVSILGNSHFHLDVFRNLMRFGGASIQHDNRLLGFYSILLGKQRAEKTASHELRRPLQAGELDRWLMDEATLEATFLGDVAAMSDPLFLHSGRTAQIVRDRFASKPVVLPFAIYRQWPEEEFTQNRKLRARRRLGISDMELAIISLGYVHNSKAPKECISALELLRSWGIPAKLYFVGEVQPPDLEGFTQFCRQIGVDNSVKFIGEYTSEATYRDYLLAADIAVQLRTHLLGGLSGALLDCIAVGLPTVANADLADSMEAPAYVERVHDRPSPVLIANAMMSIIEQQCGPVRPQQERKAFASSHNFAVYARRLGEGLALDLPRNPSV